MSAQTLLQQANDEIIQFHGFFVAWYNAETAADADFSRCEKVFSPGFTMITPNGGLFDRTRTIEVLRANRASCEGDFRISIEDITLRWEADDAILVTYIEAQQRADDHSSRLATALFVENSSAPNGVQWKHLQETWLEMPQP